MAQRQRKKDRAQLDSIRLSSPSLLHTHTHTYTLAMAEDDVILLQVEPLDEAACLRAVRSPQAGATASFIGMDHCHTDRERSPRDCASFLSKLPSVGYMREKESVCVCVRACVCVHSTRIGRRMQMERGEQERERALEAPTVTALLNARLYAGPTPQAQRGTTSTGARLCAWSTRRTRPWR